MYKLPKLPYLFQDLEPYIDTHTMGLHYHKHEQNYLNKLNELLAKNNYEYNYTLEELLYNLDKFPNEDKEDILFNLGGVLNHNLYWKGISTKSDKKPIGRLKKEIDKTFGSYENLWLKLKEKALKLKGSGYTFLVLKNNMELDIINLPNQETPLSNGHIPLFTIDMWEHAYYLNYENEKAKYLDNFEKIADFKNASLLYDTYINYFEDEQKTRQYNTYFIY